MLAAIEAYFLDAMKPEIGDAAILRTGPSTGPGDETGPLVELVASRLDVSNADGSASSARRPAFHMQVYRFPGDGVIRDVVLPEEEIRDVVLPDEKTDKVVEVESPPGRPLQRGDDYIVDGNTIRFFAPIAKGDVGALVRVRRGRARGYESTQRCAVKFSVRVWTDDRVQTDELARKVLAFALTAATDIATVDGSDAKMPSVTMRMRRIESSLSSVHRTVKTVSQRTFFVTRMTFALRGEWEEAVVMGEPERVGVILEVRRTES